MASAPNELRLFEVNLISDQVSMLLRRRALQQLASVAAALMLAAGLTLALVMAMHLKQAMRMRSGMKGLQNEVVTLQNACAELDSQREAAIKRADAIAPLLLIARQRVAWAPKLAAVANNLPLGTGLRDIQATQRDVFVVRAPVPAGSISFLDEGGLPQMNISLLCGPSAGSGEDLATFPDRLNQDKAFMDKFDYVHLTALAMENWLNRPVEVLQIHALGNVK